MRLAVLLAGAALWCPVLAHGQMANMPGMAGAAPSSPAASIAAGQAAPGAEQGGMSGMVGMTRGHMRGDLGSYPMTRDASGTAWQADSSPMEGIHGDLGGWVPGLTECAGVRVA